MKKLIKLVCFAIVLIGVTACTTDNSNNNPQPDPDVTFQATIDSSQEVPPNISAGSGTATLVYNPNTMVFTMTATYTGVTATASHIHKAAAGESGGVVFGLDPFASPINYTSPALDAEQEADLNANLYYINIHSMDFPGGEIRGQFIRQ